MIFKNLSCFTHKILKIFGLSSKYNEPFYQTLTELSANGKKMSKEEKNILTNFLKFGQKKVRDVMINRADIVSVSAKSNLEEISKSIFQIPHTRTIVTQDSLDKIIGFVHIKDLFRTLVGDSGKTTLKKITRQPLHTTSAAKLIDLLVEMRRKRTHMAIVVDEYGGTEGIVTIEDIVEEIVGEIEDEHEDKNNGNHQFTVVSDGVIITDARVSVEDIEKVIGKELRSNKTVETIGGVVLATSGNLPQVGDVINICENVVAEILDANSKSIKRLKILYSESE